MTPLGIPDDELAIQQREAEESEPLFEVIVGNIGRTYVGPDRNEAIAHFDEYKKQSRENVGRAAGETVVMMFKNEIEKEYIPKKRKISVTIKEIGDLLVSLKPTIGDEFRCTDEPEDDKPGMIVTIGADDSGWGWQTGDNSFTGGAYGFPYWGVVWLYRDSNCLELARDAKAQIEDQYCH